MWTFRREVIQINNLKGFLMNKLLAVLVAGLFTAGAFAQTPAAAAPAAPVAHKAKAKHTAKKHKVRHVTKAHAAAAKKV